MAHLYAKDCPIIAEAMQREYRDEWCKDAAAAYNLKPAGGIGLASVYRTR